MNHAIFASEEVILSQLGVQDGQKCACKDSTVTAIMHAESLVTTQHCPFVPKSSSHWCPHPLHIGWDTALFVGKYPMFAQSP